MTDVSDRILEEFIDACHSVARRGLVRCSSGNMSRRLDESRLLATATRSWMENISAKELSMCRISDGILLDGSKPTAEIAFHTAILQTRPDVNVVLHFQSPYATALACRSKDDANYFVIPEIPFYIGHVTRIPYLVPGSRELGEAVANAMQDHNMAIMSNHGLVTVANDYSHAIQNAAFFELACEIIAHGGETLNTLSEADVEALIALRHTAG